MREHDLTLSDLARRMWGTRTDRRGYTVATNRDRVGHYVAGTSYPTEQNLHKLAAIFGVPVDTLAIPERPPTGRPPLGGVLGPAPPARHLCRVTGSTAGPALMRLELDVMIRGELALQIMQLIVAEKDREETPPSEPPVCP
jgi:transcriptional regulator with XRE-family HTH domain